MAVEVNVTAVFENWYLELNLPSQEAVTRVVSLLEELGPALSFPYSSAIAGSKIALRELRIQAMGEPLRVLYAFDPSREAVLLLGGNKVGKGNRWYKSAIPAAERLYAEYLSDLGT